MMLSSAVRFRPAQYRYALEFNGPDGKYVTALWASRSEAKFAFIGKGWEDAIDMLGAKPS